VISFSVGEDIRKEKVTPSGTPASTNPINSGTAEQEQKGVSIPVSSAKIFPLAYVYDLNISWFSQGENTTE
jgi:hypothetical protein